MTISMYQVSVPIFVQFLTSLSGVIDKAAAHAEARKVEPSVYLGLRLCPDMFQFSRQVQQVTNHALSPGRLAGVALPDLGKDEADFDALKARIQKAIDFLKTLKPDQIDGTEAKEIVFKFPNGNERKFTGQELLLNFSLPNFFFHATTAYGLLRAAGVEVGKQDFMGKPAQL
ncbi:MAG TPA: DUF1993 domain-containing protein [Xanthobacteraceae bacterium]|nr:DUF1993 domain-containing protein [Xanthobacteraceae bacterium]